MDLVVDTSAVLAVVLCEPEREWIIGATRGVGLMAPEILTYEVGNALISLLRRRKLGAEEVRAAWHAFAGVPIELRKIDIAPALEMAAEHGIYAYDAYVIRSAIEARSPLLSLDRRLNAVAAGMGIKLIDGAVP